MTETPKRGRKPTDFLARISPSLSCDPCQENAHLCWIWVGKKYSIRGGQLRTVRTYKHGRLDNIYITKRANETRIPSTSLNGRVDTVVRQLYRVFISEPPAQTRRSCGIGQCCNPWHLTEALDYVKLREEASQAKLEKTLQNAMDAAKAEIEGDSPIEAEELAEMICSHWVRHPKALLDDLVATFAEDYSRSTVIKAAKLAADPDGMDGCPPMIRRQFLDALRVASLEPAQQQEPIA